MKIGLLLIVVGFVFMGYSLISLYRKAIKKINALSYVPKEGELVSLVRSVVRDKANSTQANAFVFGILASGVGIVVTFIMLLVSLL